MSENSAPGTGEKLLGVIPYVATFRSFEVYSLIFTDRRVLITRPQDLNTSAVRAAWSAGALGVFVLGLPSLAIGGLASMAAWNSVKKKSEQAGLPPVITEGAAYVPVKAKWIDYGDVTEVKLYKNWQTLGSKDWLVSIKASRDSIGPLWVNAQGVDSIRDFIKSTPVGPKLR